jgi:hypothetical protein
MSVRNCQLCGKPLGRIRVGAGEFCSREHRNQFRLRRSMDHLQEANKVATLMRRRENPKQIPLAQLIVTSAMEPRGGVQAGLFPAGHVQFDFQPLRPWLLHVALAGAGSCVSLARLGSAPVSQSLDDPAVLPFTLRSSRPAFSGRSMPESSVHLPRASMASIPCQLPGHGIEYRECQAVLHVKRKAVFEFRRPGPEAPGSAYVESKRQLHLTPQLRDIPAQEHASPAQPPERRKMSPRPFRCASRPRPELLLARPLGYDLLSIAIFSDPRPCEDAPQPEHEARIRPLRVPPPIRARPPQNPLPLSAPGGAGNAQQAQICEPEWKTESRAPSHRLRPSLAGSIDFAARPPFRFAGVSEAQAAAYHVSEVSFAPPDSAFDYTPIALHGTLASFAAEAPPPPPALEEDFNSGLGRWTGETAAWKLDVAGARPGGLALLEPSLSWTDYDFEFLTRIGKRSVTFVFRAADLENYYRITIGPAESGGSELRRAVVIAGKEEPADAMPAGERLRAGSAFTVKARVQASEVTISFDNEVVARFTEERLPAGGIGFTSLPGDQARVYWARLTPLASPISEAATGRPPRSIS